MTTDERGEIGLRIDELFNKVWRRPRRVMEWAQVTGECVTDLARETAASRITIATFWIHLYGLVHDAHDWALDSEQSVHPSRKLSISLHLFSLFPSGRGWAIRRS
jgi:hypothetical protein